MKEEQCTKEIFLRDVKDHQMTVVLDNGVNRNLIFRNPACYNLWFGITTWEDYLCIYGDMGDSVFSRNTDMFCFFRMKKNDFNYNGDLSISPGYWHEKLKSISRFEGDKKFSPKLFEENIKEYFDRLVEDDELDKQTADALWEEIDNEILCQLEDNNEESMYRLVSDFKSEDGYEFNDFWECNNREYTYHYIWQLYAIVWAIKQYDSYKTMKTIEEIKEVVGGEV